MAAATLMVGAVNVSAAVYLADGAIAGIRGDEMEPRYETYKTVSFDVGSVHPKTGSVTVVSAPVKIAYHCCSIGSARLSVSVNGSHYEDYVIPYCSGPSYEINQIINCKKGDIVSYNVTAYTGYDRASGSFTIHY